MKNTHRGVLLLVTLQILAFNFTKSNTPQWVFFTFFELYYPATLLKVALLQGCFSRFVNCANGTKSRNASHTLYLKYYFIERYLSVCFQYFLCFSIRVQGCALYRKKNTPANLYFMTAYSKEKGHTFHKDKKDNAQEPDTVQV